MKNFASGIVVIFALTIVAYITYPIFRNFGILNGKPVAPYQLRDNAKDFGALKVTVTGFGNPVTDLEVALGQPGGKMTFTKTDTGGIALFENVPAGQWSVFFNERNFPKEYPFVSNSISVNIEKDQITEQRIELGQGQ